jgi:hypothetical protein
MIVLQNRSLWDGIGGRWRLDKKKTLIDAAVRTKVAIGFRGRVFQNKNGRRDGSK